MNHLSRDVNAPAFDADRALVETLQAKIALFVRASFDEENISRSGLQCLGLIVEDGDCWRGYEGFVSEIQKRTEAPNPLATKTIQNDLSDLRRVGYITRERRETPEAKGAKLTHYQVAILAAAIERELNVVPFPSRSRGTNPPATAGSTRPSGTNHPAPVGKSRISGTSTKNSSVKKSSYVGGDGAARRSPNRNALADALRASGEILHTAEGWIPSPRFHDELKRKYPGIDYLTITAAVIGNAFDWQKNQTAEIIVERIRGTCAKAFMSLGAPKCAAPKLRPTPRQPMPLSHNGETIMLPREHWLEWQEKYDNAPMPRNKQDVFERARAFAIEEARA